MTDWSGERFVGSVGLSADADETAHAEPWVSGEDLVRAIGIVVGLTIVGIPVGLIWQAISSHSVGFVTGSGSVIPDEGEGFIAADARFALLTVAVGVLAALGVWSRPMWRGPSALVALAVGAVAGALVTAAVGNAVGGGHAGGKANTLIMLPIAVRAHGLLFAEALAAVVLCCAFTVFAREDSLRSRSAAPTTVPDSTADVG